MATEKQPATKSENSLTEKTGAAATETASDEKMTRHINGRFLLLLGVVMLVLGGGVFGLHAVQMKRNAASLLDLATEAEEQGKTQEAMSFLTQYLRFEPKDYDAKVRLADLFEQSTRDVRVRLRVLNLLEEVLRNDPDRADARKIRRRAIDLSLSLARFRNALLHIKTLQEKRPHDAELLFLEGRCEIGLSQPDKALVKFLSAITLSKEKVDYYVALIATLQRFPKLLTSQESLGQLKNPRIDGALLSLFPRRKPAIDKSKNPVVGKNGETVAGKNRKPVAGKSGKPVAGKKVAGKKVLGKKVLGKKVLGKKVLGKKDSPKKAGRTNPVDVESVVKGLFNLLIKQGRPRYLAHLARAQYFIAQGNLTAADADIAAARKLAAHASLVLYKSAAIELLRSNQSIQAYESKQQLRGHLDRAQQYADAGVGLKAPDNLPFFTQLAQIAQLRARLTDDDVRRNAMLRKADQRIGEGLKARETYLKSSSKKSFDELNRLLLRKIELLSLHADLLLKLARRDDGGLNEKQMQDYGKTVGELQKLGASKSLLGLYNAQSLLARHQWRAALEGLTAVRRRVAPTSAVRRQIDSALAVCHKQLHNVTARIDVLKQGLAVDPRWHQGRFLFAEALAAQGKLNDSLEQYRRLVFVYKRGQLMTPYLRVLLRKIATLSPTRQTEALVKVDQYIRDVEKLYQEQQTDTSEITILRVQVLAIDKRVPNDKRFPQIEKLLDDAILKKPDNSGLQIVRARFEVQRPGRTNLTTRIAAAFKLLDAAKQKFPTLNDFQADLAIGRAEIAASLPADEAVPVLKKIAFSAQKLPPPRRKSVLESVARGYATVGEIDKARAIWKQVSAASPNDLGVYLAAATLAALRADKQDLAAQLPGIRKIEGDRGPWGNYFAARLLLASVSDDVREFRKELPLLSGKVRMVRRKMLQTRLEKPLGEARRLLEYAARLHSQWPQLFHELGRVEALRKNRRGAFEHFERAILLGDRSSLAFIYAVRYLRDERRFERARELLELASRSSSQLLSADKIDLTDGTASLSELAISIATARHDFDKARSFLANDSQDFRQKMLLSMLEYIEHSLLSDKEKKTPRGLKLLTNAKTFMQEAIKLSPKTPEPWIFAVEQMTRLKQTAEAEKTIAAAEKALPKELRAITAARCYSILRNTKKAEAKFLAAIQLQPDDAALRLTLSRFYTGQNQFSQAGPHLEKVLDPDFPASNAQRAEARHLKILSVAARGKYSDLVAALKLLDSPETASLADLYTRSLLLQRSPLKRDRVELIDVLERIDSVRRLSVENRFQLARLYTAVNRWGNAGKIMDELLQNQPRNARFLAWYAVTSLTHHRGRSRPDVARARGFLARLRTLEPDSARTAEVHARILVLDKQSAQAAGLLQTVAGRIVNKQSKLPETQLVQLRLIAKLCEQLKLTVAAEQLYQQQARLSGTPSDVLRQATFLGRQSRYKDGLAICRDAQKTCKPMAVAVTAVNVVSLGNPSRSDLVAAEQLVKIALAAEPKSVRIQMAYAGLLSAAGRLAESESRYREILQGSPDNIAMLNNLAWLLAMQEKDLLEASTLIERAIGQSGPLSTLLDTRGIILTKMGNATQAMADLKQALQEVDNPEVHLHLAQALLAAGDRTAAIASFREAKEKGLALARLHRLEQPGYHALLAALGENARKSGKPAKESP